ncbi:hypothetical protein, partial [Stenotrophomonas sp. MMGLT7]|uniref:hypothetical protein n=1 Tax=Stenotrophomonas sp. MMGLT7 TaxID=2901227 RepID=UPI001E518BA4
MAEAPAGFDERIERRLDALARAGQRVLSRRARRSAWRRARAWALASTVVVPLLALLAAGFAVVDARWMLAGCLLLPVLVAAIVQGVLLSRRRDDRRAALALVDGHVGARDRISAADQFVHERNRDPFRDAAVQDALPWIERALAAAIEPPPVPVPRLERRLWLFPLAAALLLVAALLLQRGHVPSVGAAAATVAGATSPAAPLPGSAQAGSQATDADAERPPSAGQRAAIAAASAAGPRETAASGAAAAAQAGAAGVARDAARTAAGVAAQPGSG